LIYGQQVCGPLDIIKELWEADKWSNESVVYMCSWFRKLIKDVRANKRELEESTQFKRNAH